MARTPGAVSNVSISFPSLLHLMGVKYEGPVYQGAITVSAKWVVATFQPEQYEIIEVGEKSVSELLTGLGLKAEKAAEGKAPVFTAI